MWARRSPSWRIFRGFTTTASCCGNAALTMGGDLLFDTWSTATECMINFPGANSHPSSTDGVLYMTPVPPSNVADAGTNSPWPTIFVDNVLFCLTAYNPMGNTVPHEENVNANMALEQDILQLYNDTNNGPGDNNDNNINSSSGVPLAAWWHSFGFHEQEGWRENGYTLAFPVNKEYDDSDGSSASSVVTTVMNLANKYHQAAIYKFSYEHGVVIREVVYVVDHPNADQQQKQSSKDVMMIVSKPPSALADRYWRPSKLSSPEHLL